MSADIDTSQPTVSLDDLAMLLDSCVIGGSFSSYDAAHEVEVLAGPALRTCPKCSVTQWKRRDNCIACDQEFDLFTVGNTLSNGTTQVTVLAVGKSTFFGRTQHGIESAWFLNAPGWKQV